MIHAEVVASVVEENTSPIVDLDVVETQVGCTDTPLESSCDEQLEIRDSVKSELKIVDCDEPRTHGRVFTPSELNQLWKGLSIGADDETEEYDKELEERLNPLDEAELKRRMEQNAERVGSLTLEDMSTLLNITIAILEKNSESSPDELSTPEYWLAWYKRTLVAAEGAKRANREFPERSVGSKVKNDGSYPADEDDRDVGVRQTVYALVKDDELAFNAKSAHCQRTAPVEGSDFKRVHFDHSSLFAERSEAFYDSAFERDENCDLYDYMYVVHDNAAVKRQYRPGLVEVSVVNDESDSDDKLVAEGFRVIGSVNGIEALSGGHIDCTPAELYSATTMQRFIKRPFVVVNRMHFNATLGLTSYFRRYIPGYAGISASIERLKLKGAAFV
ncbi:hypothetical protein PHMEG_00035733, partial [Phytophthora megakarya]